MKVEKLNPTGFQPIELKIVIESEVELRDLWHRLNINPENICSISGGAVSTSAIGECFHSQRLWGVINSEAERLNLKSK